MRRRFLLYAGACTGLLAAAVAACSDADAPETDGVAATESAHAAFMANLAHHCGEHFPGRLTLEPEGDPMLTGTELLVVHFRDCAPDEVRITFHVELAGEDRWDRSRTWYVMQHGDRLELRHDHREPDGAESARTWYGGFTERPGTATRQDFASPERTARAGVPVGWRIEIEPGVRYAYGTTLDNAYDWRIEFDLSSPLDGSPPMPWGHERAPSRAPGPP